MNRNELSFTDALIELTDYKINMVKVMVKVAAFLHLKVLKNFYFDFAFQS